MTRRVGPVRVGHRVPWTELSTLRKARRAGGWLVNASLVALVASAATSESEVGLRADGTRAPRHEDGESVQGDPKVKAQRDQAGEKKEPADPADAAASGTGDDAAAAQEKQGGNAAEDTEKAAESTS